MPRGNKKGTNKGQQSTSTQTATLPTQADRAPTTATLDSTSTQQMFPPSLIQPNPSLFQAPSLSDTNEQISVPQPFVHPTPSAPPLSPQFSTQTSGSYTTSSSAPTPFSVPYRQSPQAFDSSTRFGTNEQALPPYAASSVTTTPYPYYQPSSHPDAHLDQASSTLTRSDTSSASQIGGIFLPYGAPSYQGSRSDNGEIHSQQHQQTDWSQFGWGSDEESRHSPFRSRSDHERHGVDQASSEHQEYNIVLPLYQIAKGESLVNSGNGEERTVDLGLHYFHVESTIAAIEQRIVHGLNEPQPRFEEADEDEQGMQVSLLGDQAHSTLVTLQDLRNSDKGEYAPHRKKIAKAMQCMTAFNTQTKKLQDKLRTALASHRDLFTVENAEAIATAQRDMIYKIADLLNGTFQPQENRTVEEQIKFEANTFKETYNEQFKELRRDHKGKSFSWGVGVGVAMAAVGVGLAFAAFLVLPIFAPELGLALFSPDFFITLASTAGGLGIASGIGSTISASQNRYAHGRNVRGEASRAKEAAMDTAKILDKLDFINDENSSGHANRSSAKNTSSTWSFADLFSSDKKQKGIVIGAPNNFQKTTDSKDASRVNKAGGTGSRSPSHS